MRTIPSIKERHEPIEIAEIFDGLARSVREWDGMPTADILFRLSRVARLLGRLEPDFIETGKESWRANFDELAMTLSSLGMCLDKTKQ